jgi:phage gpG-like protein
MTVATSGDDAIVTIASPYAAVHQLGSAGKGGIPARPYFPVLNGQLTDDGVEAINDVVEVLVGSAYEG